MTPDQLSPASFVTYAEAARAFALAYLPLLRRLPLAICPSFLQQIQGLDTSFPAERASLRSQCDSLQRLPGDQFAALVKPLLALSLSASLEASTWVDAPASFVTELTSYLWSSGQVNAFRVATAELFAAIPTPQDTTHRLVLVLLGQGATVDSSKVLRRLRRQGTFLNALEHDATLQGVRTLMQQHAGASPEPYTSWYVDGGEPNADLADHRSGMLVVSYPALAKIRERVLQRMQATISSGSGGAEQMRSHLAETSRMDVGAQETTSDAVLQRFYTELFTQSSGPQIFSTSFVQWTGRELARRAQPHTLLLRYAPRQRHRDLNELFAETQPNTLDPQGSLRDAEMGAYYNWIEMNRISAPGKLTFAVVVEGHPLGVVIGEGSRAGTICSTPMTLERALQTFG